MSPSPAPRPSSRTRLDLELVRRGLATTRAEAQRAIDAGKVLVRGVPARRTATQVAPDEPISFVEEPGFVSRGGLKLEAALDQLDIDVTGRMWLDAGASTGGFTDCLLRRGARGVVAVDVGYGQLDWTLRNDERVVVLERTNVRHLQPNDLPWTPTGVVADLSFISLALVLPALRSVASPDADFVLLVKPQFEAGKGNVGKGGVVRDPEVWRAAIEKVVSAGRQLGLGFAAATVAEPPGPAGNREFFVHLYAGAGADQDAIDGAIAEVTP